MFSLRSFICASVAALGAVDFADATLFGPGDAAENLLYSYDYLIVGGGPSGLTVARRLTEDPDVTVLVVEAGYLDHNRDLSDIKNADFAIPGYIAHKTPNKQRFNWNMSTVPQEFLNNKARPFGQGKAIGGATIFNGMVWTRGAKSEIDSWAALGNKGWGWDDLLPYFKKSEKQSTNLSPEYMKSYKARQTDLSNHGVDGPIHVSYANYQYPQTLNFLQAWEGLGVPINPDINSGDTSGVAVATYCIEAENQTRSDARVGHFDVMRDRDNLHIFTNLRVTKLFLSPPTDGPRRVAGITFQEERDGRVYTVKAKKEVIMAAGAIFTPTLLQVSGIGNNATLRKLSIETKVEVPGVGFNFQDHPTVPVEYTLGDDSLLTSKKFGNDALGEQYLEEFVRDRTGPYTAPVVNAIAFIPLKKLVSDAQHWLSQWINPDSENLPSDTPDTVRAGYKIQRGLVDKQLTAEDVGMVEIEGPSTGTLTTVGQKIYSRGTIRPKTNSIWDGPAIDPRYCSDPADCDIVVLGIKSTNRLVRTPAYEKLQVSIPQEFDTDDHEKLLELVKNKIGTGWHPGGSASMMPENLGGVVDENLKVYGLCNLRIVDASIMPIIPGVHLLAAVYAIAEKAADLIKAGGYCEA